MAGTNATTVLVVGCGYIGLPFAWHAKQAGCRVFATTRKPARSAELKDLGFNPVIWEVCSPAGVATNDVLPEVDAVVYCVGFDRSAGRTMEEVFVSGLALTLFGLKGKPKIVYASSTGVYGDALGAWIDETAPLKPMDVGGKNCLKAERLLALTAKQQGFAFCILRFAGLYGLGRMLNSAALQRGEPIPGDGSAWINLVEQRDAALALWKAVQHGESGEVYNFADGHPVRRQDFYLKLAELLNASPPTFAPELAKRQRGNRRINADKARSKLGWSPKFPSYVEGLEAIVKESSGEP